MGFPSFTTIIVFLKLVSAILEPEWAVKMGGINWDQRAKTVVDKKGDVYVLGQYWDGAASFYDKNQIKRATETPLTSNGIILSKYDSDGLFLWSVVMDGPDEDGVGWDSGPAMAIDSKNNLYIRDRLVALGNKGGMNSFVVKLSSLGQVLWATRIEGSDNDWSSSVAIDQFDNVVMGGSSSSSDTSFYSAGSSTPSKIMNAPIGSAGYLAKFTQNGQFLWATYIDGASNENVQSVSFDSDGNVLAIGNAGNVVVNAFSASNPTVFQSTIGAFMAKFNAAGDILWIQSPAQNPSVPTATRIDSQDNIYVSGYLYNELSIRFRNGSLSQLLMATKVDSYDVFLSKYNSRGHHVWTAKIGGNAYFDYSHAMTIDSFDEVLIGGYTESPEIMFWAANSNTGPTIKVAHGNGGFGFDAFIAKYDKNGVPKWASHVSGAVGYSISTDADANVYFAGDLLEANILSSVYDSKNTAKFTLSRMGGRNIFLVKYSNAIRSVAQIKVTENVQTLSINAADYLNNIDNFWVLQPTIAEKLRLTFNGSTEEFGDKIEVFDSATADSNKLISLTGSLKDKVVTVNKNMSMIRFRTNSKITTSGWSVKIEQLKRGGWSEWTSFSLCSSTCSTTGIKTMIRTCTTPLPLNGGDDCIGPSLSSESCIADCTTMSPNPINAYSIRVTASDYSQMSNKFWIFDMSRFEAVSGATVTCSGSTYTSNDMVDLIEVFTDNSFSKPVTTLSGTLSKTPVLVSGKYLAIRFRSFRVEVTPGWRCDVSFNMTTANNSTLVGAERNKTATSQGTAEASNFKETTIIASIASASIFSLVMLGGGILAYYRHRENRNKETSLDSTNSMLSATLTNITMPTIHSIASTSQQFSRNDPYGQSDAGGQHLPSWSTLYQTASASSKTATINYWNY